jgi:hypothetical protein
MLTMRYLVLLLALHLVSILHFMPWAWVWGVVQWPYWCWRLAMIDHEHKRSCIAQGARWTLKAEGKEIPPMPVFLRRRLENVYQEALS